MPKGHHCCPFGSSTTAGPPRKQPSCRSCESPVVVSESRSPQYQQGTYISERISDSQNVHTHIYIYIYLLVHRNNGCCVMIVHALSKNEPPPRLNSRAGKDRRCYKTSAKKSVLSEIRRKELHKYSAIVQNGSKNEPLPRLNSRAVKDGAELKK